MKPDQNGCWLLFLFFFLCCFPALAQSSPVAGEVHGSTPGIFWTTEEGTVPSVAPDFDEQASASPPSEKPAQQPYGWRIGVYPALAWAPIFGASFTLPPLPSNPEVSPSGSTDTSFNGAYFGGARFEPGKWSVDFLFMWAALSAERKSPLANVDLDFVFGDAMGGREVVPGLYVEGGFRRLALDIHATTASESTRRSPGYWDPLLGLTYRRQLGKKWRILLHGDGGGFGVGSDVDVTATGRAEWQFARHFGLAMGYGGMHFSETNTVRGETLTISPTMHGPILGFGIFF